MTLSRVLGATLAVAATLMISGCFGGTTPPQQEPASIVMTIDELQGSDVQLAVDQTLGIEVEGVDAPLYDAMILDGSIASYEPSRDGSEIRIVAVDQGTTDVLLGDPDGSVDDVSFTLTVTK